MKRLLLIFGLLSFALPAWSQQLTVTATVVDPNGKPFASGTSAANLVCAGNAQAYFGTSPISRSTPTVGLDGNGHFSQVLYDTSLLVDVNHNPLVCNYVYTVTDQCGIASFTTGSLSGITGAGPVDISVQINSFAVPLSAQCTPGGGGSGQVGPGTPNTLSMFITPTTIGDSPVLFDPINTDIVSADVVVQPASGYFCANSASGTTNRLLVTRDANGNCINLPDAQTNKIIGVVKDGGGTTGISRIVKIGSVPIILDNQSVIDDCIIAAATGARGHDAGPTCPNGVQSLGIAQTVNGGAGTAATVDAFISDIVEASGPSQTLTINNITILGSFINLSNTTPAAQTNQQLCTFQTDNGTPTSNVSLECT